MRARTSERGAALLVVVVAVAILTALAAEVAFTARVRLQLAADARDELRASWLARSGVETARLVLALQQQVDAAAGGAAGGIPGIPGVAQPAAGSNPMPALRIWALVPVSSGLVTGLLGGGSPPERPANAPGAPTDGAPPLARFGDFDGAFQAEIDDEGAKVNAQFDAWVTSGRLGPQVLALYQLVCDPRWDPLFDREDAHGQRVTRQDLLVYLKDFVDDDEASSALVASFPGAACLMQVPDNPFENGFGDENAPYDRGPGEERYRAKNARLDSLEELHLVAGVSDAFMGAFGDRLTVYLPKESRRTIDPRNPGSLVELAMSIADPPGQAILFDPEFRTRLQKAVLEQSLGGLLAVSSQAFAQLLVSFGVQVSPAVTTPGSPRNYLADRSYVYRVRSTGSAGQVERTLDAVVTFDPQLNKDAPPPGKNPGRLLRWREE
jgi:general secretion pathway protein K